MAKGNKSNEMESALWAVVVILVFFYMMGCNTLASRTPFLIEDISISEGDINNLILGNDTNAQTGCLDGNHLLGDGTCRVEWNWTFPDAGVFGTTGPVLGWGDNNGIKQYYSDTLDYLVFATDGAGVLYTDTNIIFPNAVLSGTNPENSTIDMGGGFAGGGTFTQSFRGCSLSNTCFNTYRVDLSLPNLQGGANKFQIESKDALDTATLEVAMKGVIDKGDIGFRFTNLYDSANRERDFFFDQNGVMDTSDMFFSVHGEKVINLQQHAVQINKRVDVLTAGNFRLTNKTGAGSQTTGMLFFPVTDLFNTDIIFNAPSTTNANYLWASYPHGTATSAQSRWTPGNPLIAHSRIGIGVNEKSALLEVGASATGTNELTHLFIGGDENVLGTLTEMDFNVGTDTPEFIILDTQVKTMVDSNIIGTGIFNNDLNFIGDHSGLAYGELWANDSQEVITLVQDVDQNFKSDWNAGHMNGFAHDGNGLKWLGDNNLMVNIVYSVSFETTAGASQEIEFHLKLDDRKIYKGASHRAVATSSNIGNTGGVALIEMAAGNTLYLTVMNESGNNDVIVDHANFVVTGVGG